MFSLNFRLIIQVDHCARVNKHLALVLNIESQPAIDNLDEILKIPDIDAILIGPHDLSCNLGVPGLFLFFYIFFYSIPTITINFF